MERETHTIDATGKVLGRLSSQISVLLQGKHRPNFYPNKDTGDFVVVKNISQIKLTGKKVIQKKYFRHSGYLGEDKEIPFRVMFAKKPGEVLRIAVSGMLPKNRLRKVRLKRLTIEK